jgi:hypothetical protein
MPRDRGECLISKSAHPILHVQSIIEAMALNSLFESAESGSILNSNCFIEPCNISVNRVHIIKLPFQKFDFLGFIFLEVVNADTSATENLHVHVKGFDPNLSFFTIDAPINS